MAQKQTSDGSRSIAQASTHPETRVVTPAKWAVGRWFDRFMKVTKPVAQISTPIIIAVVGSWYNCATAKQHDYQAAVQILNQREQSELQARGAVFEKPIAALVDKSNT